MMCWLKAMPLSAWVMPGSPLKKRKPVAATARAAGAGFGARIPRAKTYAPTGSSMGPRAVTSLNATL